MDEIRQNMDEIRQNRDEVHLDLLMREDDSKWMSCTGGSFSRSETRGIVQNFLKNMENISGIGLKDDIKYKENFLKFDLVLNKDISRRTNHDIFRSNTN